MKPGGSGLNPNAAAYVPLSKREADSSKPVAATHQPYGYGVQQGKGNSQMHSMTTDEDLETDMEIEFLLASFSNLSHESISDVYLANNGDLDATIEMLNQLEIFSNEAEEYLPLPDTLDIGDVPETIETETETSSAPLKPKSASNEASASSSSTSSGTTNNNAPV